jgi:thymidine phosphorylase
MSLAEVAREMGAGRFALEDEIQPAVGYILNYKKGDSIALGSQWIEIHHNEPLSLEQMEKLRRAIKVEEQVIPPLERLIRTVR